MQAREIKEWVEKKGRLPLNSKDVDEEEKKLGEILADIRQWLKKGKEGTEEVREIIEELDEKYKEKGTG